MEKQQIKEILQRYHTGECSEEERAWIETWYNTHSTPVDDLSDEELELDLSEVYKGIPQKHKVIPLWSRVAAAMVLFGLLYVGLHAYLANLPERSVARETKTAPVSDDIAPGGNKATLTLADGSTISLNEAEAGEIAQQEGLVITKTDDGQIIYDLSHSSAKSEQLSVVTYNKIATPRGGQYRIILPDGTKVWLNAASSLTYPTTFTGNERKVELTGEAYFEVASKKEYQNQQLENKYVPFFVSTSFQLVKVMGTHFNINAYEDEPFTRTTLLEGSVKVIPHSNAGLSKETNSLVLNPGEQSLLRADHMLRVKKINTANAVAWKSGLFQFQNSDIESVMRQFSRWYDVEVEFEGDVPDLKLWGEVYRNVNASQALEILEYFNLKYRIEQTNGVKKIIIS